VGYLIDGNRVGVFQMNFENEISDYIRWSAAAMIPFEVYVALEEVCLPVPDAAFRPSAVLINRLQEEELVRLALTYPHTKVASFAIENFGSHEMALGSLVVLLYGCCKKENPGWIPGTIATLAKFLHKEESSAG
jgi:hypothetical protein